MALAKHDRALLEAAEVFLLKARDRIDGPFDHRNKGRCGPIDMPVWQALVAIVNVLGRGDDCDYVCACEQLVIDERFGCCRCVDKIIRSGYELRQRREAGDT